MRIRTFLILLKIGLCVGSLLPSPAQADESRTSEKENKPSLRILPYNSMAISESQSLMKTSEQFRLIAPVALKPSPTNSPIRNWNILPSPLNREEASHYVGLDVEASRAFKVSIRIFTNFGQYVNKIEFTVSPEEFDKLSKGITKNTRILRILWDNRAQDGSLAGTGAYVLKTDVTLLKIPGIAEDQVLLSEYRIVGLLRPN